MNLLVALLLVLLVPAAIVAVLYQKTRVKDPLSFGPLKVTCPHCEKPQAYLRLPTTAEEIFFGGYTCGNCRGRIEQYGRERFARER